MRLSKLDFNLTVEIPNSNFLDDNYCVAQPYVHSPPFLRAESTAQLGRETWAWELGVGCQKQYLLRHSTYLMFLLYYLAKSRAESTAQFGLVIDRNLTVAEQFYWTPGLRDEITYYINTCKTCQDGKRLPSKPGPGLGQTASRLEFPVRFPCLKFRFRFFVEENSNFSVFFVFYP